jgi:arylsulfatase A-like enzyme
MDGRVLDPDQHIGRSVAMPRLRALAAAGVNFVNAYTHSPVCGPSRASALTSRFIHDIGTFNNFQEIVASPVGLDTRCVKRYGDAQCTAWAAEFPGPDGIFFDAFADAGFDVKVFGKVVSWIV